jgi:beta-lactamase class A
MKSPAPHSDSRRLALKLAVSTLAAQAVSACGSAVSAQAPDAGAANAAVTGAVNRFSAMSPDGTHCLVYADVPDAAWSAAANPDRQLFIGSAAKTFVLAQTLLDTAAQRNGLTEATQQQVSDAVRTAGSPVLANLDGTLPMRSVLEAMIAHSDNTATDIAFAAVTPSRVRQLIAQAGLSHTVIPDSTRLMFSYIAGAPYGTDLGWSGLRALGDEPLPNARPAVNDRESMLSTATEMVSWYRQALSGALFPEPATLVEFRRIHAMANAIAVAVPTHVAAYGKGGSIDWEGFHAICFAGQMVVDQVPVTFCFTYNWSGTQTSTGAPASAFVQAVKEVLQAAVDAVRA